LDKYANIITESFKAPKLVSVFIPTRTRFTLLQKSIKSLRESMTNPADLEILVAVDNDDVDTTSQLYLLGDIKVTIGKFVGYSGTAYRHNRMFELSTGEFLLLWGDDALMMTKGWDELIRKHKGQVCIPFSRDETTCFIHRAIPTAWGIFTPYYCAEIIYKLIALELGVYIRYDNLSVTNMPVSAVGREIGPPMPPDGWMEYKDDIYKFTDSFKPYCIPIPSGPPLCKHPINDVARGKIYYGAGAAGTPAIPPCIG